MIIKVIVSGIALVKQANGKLSSTTKVIRRTDEMIIQKKTEGLGFCCIIKINSNS